MDDRLIMYESYFGLTGLPFQVTPDPSLVFHAKAYRSAFVAVREGLASGVKVMVVTGEPGVGKTTLVHALLASIDSAETATAHVSASDLDGETLADRVCEALGQPRLAEALERRDALLARLHSSPTATLLVIDEAQHLGSSAFDLLETMARGPATGSARLQICMLGQPELRMLLNASDRGRFRELVGVDVHLGPLEENEIRLYAEHRLHRSGWTGRPEFEDAAFFEIFVFTAGVPRRVNLLCNSLLLAACVEKQPRIDAAAVSRAAMSIRSDSFPRASDLPQVEVQVAQAPFFGEARQASRREPASAADSRSVIVPVAGATPTTRPALESAVLHPPQRARRGGQRAILVSAASVAIALTLTGVVYVVDRQSAPDSGSQVEPHNVAARRATGPVTPAEALPENPRSPDLPSSAAAPGTSATRAAAAPAEPASAEAAPGPSAPVDRAPPAWPTQETCSGPAFALNLCDAETSSATRRR